MLRTDNNKPKSLRQLRAEEKELRKRLNEVDKAIYDTDVAKQLPGLKEYYEGQYFKTITSYGGDKPKKFAIYYHVVSVDDLRYCKATRFSIDEYQNINIQQDNCMSMRFCGKKISKGEYDLAYKNMLAHVKLTVKGKLNKE